jgi:hypothetical protein
MVANDSNTSKTDDFLLIINKMDTISLNRFTVVGNYVRYNENLRNSLKNLKQKIIQGLKESYPENYLIWGPPGTGKSYLIQQIAESIEEISYFELNLAKLEKDEFYSKLNKISLEKPMLCLIDEIDSKPSESWPYEVLLPYLDPSTSPKKTCFVLAGSGGENISEMKEQISKRQKGNDLLSRIPFRNEFVISPLEIGDRVLVILSQLLKAGRDAGKKIKEVEKLALCYIALNPRLSSARQLRDLAKTTVRRLPKGEDRIKYDHLFSAGDPENKEFYNKWIGKGITNSFVCIENGLSSDQKFSHYGFGKGKVINQHRFERVKELFHPEMASPKGKKQRREYSKIVRKRIQNYFEKGQDIPEYYARMLQSDPLTLPIRNLSKDEWFIDCIASVVSKESKNIVILPSGDSFPEKEGIGRTSILMKLLGRSIDFGELIGLQLKDIKKLDNIPIIRNEGDYNLIAADMIYLGCNGKRLSLVPTLSEQMSFIWDLARHVFRKTTLGYTTGLHRRYPQRKKLYEIFCRIDLEEIKDVYGSFDKISPVDEIFLLKSIETGRPMKPSLRLLQNKESLNQVKKAILVSAEHGSDFWKRDKALVEKRVDSMFYCLDMKKFPAVYEIQYSNFGSYISEPVFDEVVERIKTKKSSQEIDSSQKINMMMGINEHNYLLSSSFQGKNNLKLLMTSGEKTFRDIGFWNSLSEVKQPMVLEILLLNPNSSYIESREEEAYLDKYRKGFLKKEISKNVETIKRIGNIIKNSNNKVEIVCRFYNDKSGFRMTFVGNDTLYVTSYKKENRTGKDTVFYELNRHDQDALFSGFETEYYNIRKNSEKIVEI